MSFPQWDNALHIWRDGGREAGQIGGIGGVSVWVMPCIDVYETPFKQSEAVAGGGHPLWVSCQATKGQGSIPATTCAYK